MECPLRLVELLTDSASGTPPCLKKGLSAPLPADAALQPEKRLMLAVLGNAIEVLASPAKVAGLFTVVLPFASATFAVRRQAFGAVPTNECLVNFNGVPAFDINGDTITCSDCDASCDAEGRRDGAAPCPDADVSLVGDTSDPDGNSCDTLGTGSTPRVPTRGTTPLGRWT